MKVERFHADNVEHDKTLYLVQVVTLPTDVPGVVIYVGADRMSATLGHVPSDEDVRRAAREITQAFEEVKPKGKAKKARKRK